MSVQDYSGIKCRSIQQLRFPWAIIALHGVPILLLRTPEKILIISSSTRKTPQILPGPCGISQLCFSFSLFFPSLNTITIQAPNASACTPNMAPMKTPIGVESESYKLSIAPIFLTVLSRIGKVTTSATRTGCRSEE